MIENELENIWAFPNQLNMKVMNDTMSYPLFTLDSMVVGHEILLEKYIRYQLFLYTFEDMKGCNTLSFLSSLPIH